ncbi:MAG: multi antimicrobial extrusion protein MatE [Blastococcus sp.]|nr:multi antimicrobial extrusion protein MatE [Blastococcus sp.]
MSTTAPGAPAKVAGSAGLPSIARGGALNLAGAGISAIAGVLLVVVVTRALPQRDAGVFFALTSVFLLAEMVARLGTGTGLVYFIARLRSLGRTDRIRAFQRVALTPVVVLSLITCAVLVTWAPELARLVGGPGDQTRTAVVVLAVLLPVTTLSDTLLAATRGHATMVPTVVLDRVGRPLLQLGLVAVAVMAGSTAVLAGAWALPWAVSAALAWVWLLRLGRELHVGRHSAEAHPRAGADDDAAPWREFWSFTGPRAVNSLAQLALQRLDIILVTVLIGPAQAAVYTAATRFLVVGQLTSTAIATAAQPRLAEQLAVGDRASAKAVYQSATAWIVLLNWPLYLLCAVFADVVLAVFGNGYDAGRPVVLVLAGAMLVASGCGMVDMLLNMAGRTSWTLANSVVALAVMVGVDLVLIPRLGILGAGIGWAAAIIANNALPLTQLVVSMGLHPFGRATLRAGGLSAVCFGILPGAAALLLPDDLLAAAGAVLVGLTVFLTVSLRRREALGLPALSALRPNRRPAAPDAESHARHAAQPPSGGTR